MELGGIWKLYYAPWGKFKPEPGDDLKELGIPCVSATVPGNVELDLSAAGLLPADLFKGENILAAEKYEHYEWWYETTFTAPEPCGAQEEMILRFRGVDCYADYWLNGRKLGSSENMFIAHEFDVTGALLYGQPNTLRVHIDSAVIRGAQYPSEPINDLSWMQHSPHLQVRKPAHSYGWDIMPRAVSAGIWRQVQLEKRPKYRFRYLLLHVQSLEGPNAKVVACYDSILPPSLAFREVMLTIHGKCGSHEFSHTSLQRTNAGKVDFVIPNVRLWWPKYYGEPNLYDITVTLCDMDGNELMRMTQRHGFRMLQLDRTDTVRPGGRFRFVVNGKPIMVFGSNWVPLDAYHSRDASRLPKALSLLDDVGGNIVRCWGGNVYEDHPFFDFCDAHGILVWQDFSMACHVYPMDSDFIRRLEQEAAWVISQYRHHPSIALWAGDNEVDELLWKKGIDPAVNRLTREVLPRMVDRLDPFRPYLASSPYVSAEAFRLGPAYHPETHLWGPRDYFKSSFYKDSKAYFVSETGYHGCPARTSIERFIDEEKVWPYFNNSQWNLHSSDQFDSDKRTMLMHKQVAQLFGEVPEEMDDYILASQISQAEAKKYFIERVRAKMDRMGGVIWWNLLDGWPQMSDAVVDYYHEKKLAYGFIRRSSREFVILLDEMESWAHSVLCANNTFKTIRGTCTVTDLETDEVLLQTDFTAQPNSNTRIGRVERMYSQQSMLLIRWVFEDGISHWNTYLCGMPGFQLSDYKRWLNKLPQED